MIEGEQATQSEMTFGDLPNDCVEEVFKWLTIDELVFSARLVCKRWYDVSRYPTLWNDVEVKLEFSSDSDLRRIGALLNAAPFLRALKYDEESSFHYYSRFIPSLMSCAPSYIRCIECLNIDRSFPALLSLVNRAKGSLKSLRVILKHLGSNGGVKPALIDTESFWQIINQLSELEDLAVSTGLTSCTSLSFEGLNRLRTLRVTFEPCFSEHISRTSSRLFVKESKNLKEQGALFSALAECTQLRSLTVPCAFGEAEALNSLDLAGLETLEELGIQFSSPNASDTEVTAHHLKLPRLDHKLTTLSLINETTSSDDLYLDIVRNLKGVQTLRLEHCRLPTGNVLSHLTSLEILELIAIDPWCLKKIELNRDCVPNLREIHAWNASCGRQYPDVCCLNEIGSKLRSSLSGITLSGFECNHACEMDSDSDNDYDFYDDHCDYFGRNWSYSDDDYDSYY